MSRNIPVNRTWRVTFIERANPTKQFVHIVFAPTKRLALWNAREQFNGTWMIAHPHYAERVGVIRQPNMCRGAGR